MRKGRGRSMEGPRASTLMKSSPTVLGSRRFSVVSIHPKDNGQRESPSTSSLVSRRRLSPLLPSSTPFELGLLLRSGHSVCVPSVSSPFPSSQYHSQSSFDRVIGRMVPLSSLRFIPSAYAEITERPSSRSLFSSADQYVFESISLKRRKGASSTSSSLLSTLQRTGCLSCPSEMASTSRWKKTHATGDAFFDLPRTSASAYSSEANGDRYLLSWCLWKSFFSRYVGILPFRFSLDGFRLQFQILYTLLFLFLSFLSLISLAPCSQYHSPSARMLNHAGQTGLQNLSQVSTLLLPHVVSARAADTTDVSTSASEGEGDSISRPKKREKPLIPPYNYQEILDEIQDLASSYPALVKLRDWGAETGLNIFMEKFSCGKDMKCELPLLEVGNFDVLSSSTPTLFFSGAIHGDERAGPTAAVELVRYLCDRYGVDGEVTYLVNHRRVLVMPYPNAVGFAWNFRAEVNIDVNRDFPYQRQADQCFRSVAARAINELFRRNLIIGGITWHGGMRALSYPWGSLNHSHQLSNSSWQSRPSPDDAAFQSLSKAMQKAAGIDGESDQYYYPIGSMTDLVYPVSGGMEDWAYGASFEASPDPISVCTPEAQEVSNSHVGTSPSQNSIFSAFVSSPSNSKPLHLPSSKTPGVGLPQSSEEDQTPAARKRETSSKEKRNQREGNVFGEVAEEENKKGSRRLQGGKEEDEDGDDRRKENRHRYDGRDQEREIERQLEETQETPAAEKETVARGGFRGGRGKREVREEEEFQDEDDEEEGEEGSSEVQLASSSMKPKAAQEQTTTPGERNQKKGMTSTTGEKTTKDREEKGGVMGSSSRRTHGDEREQDMTIDKSTKMVAYPSSRSVYKSDDIRVALFLVETHDQKSPSSAVMGPRPVDIPDLRLPSDEEEEEEEEEFSWFGAFAGPPRQPRRKARQNAGEYLTARNVRLALKLIEKAKPDLLFTSTPPFYQPPGAVSIFGFYAVGCNVINTAYLEIRRGNCNNFVSYRRHSFSSSSSHRSLGLNSEWTKAELLLRERAKEVPMACREMGVWERQGDLAAAMSRDRIPDGLEWWGGGGNKDIDLDQGTREEKRNRVEIQYKVPPEATDGEYCSVVFAKFDQDWRSQSNPEPRLPPQTHLARLRLEKDYYAHSSEGDSFVVGHQLWLFPRFLPALYPTVYTLGYPLVVRGDNIEGFARLHFLLPVSKPPSAKSRGRSQTTSPSRPSLSRASSSLIPVEILLNWGGNLNEKRFRLDPYTGELRHRHGKPPPLSITRVDISIRLSRSSLELPRGRFLLKIYEGGDLFHHALSQIFSTAEGQIEDEEANEEEGKAMSREKDASILLLSGKISTGPEAADDSETGYNSLVKGKRRGMIRRRLKSQTNHMNVSTPEYTASFVRIDPYNVRGSADVSVTSLLGRTLRVEWQSDNDMEDHEEIKEEKTQQEEEKKKVGIPEEKEEEKVSEERVVGYAVIGGSLHTPRIEQYVREQVKPSLHLSGQQHIAKKEEIRIHQNSSNSSSISSSSSETPHGNQGEHSVSSYVTSLVCVFRDEEGRDPSSLSKKEGGTQKGGVVHEEEKGDGKNVRKKDEEMTPTPSVEEKNKKMTDSTIPSVMKLSPAVQAADTLLQEIAGYLRLTFAIEGEPKRLEDQTKGNASDKEHLKEKGDQEDGKESFLKGHAHMHAELCGIKMTTSPSRPLLTLKFHEDCCPPQVLVPVKSHRRVLKPSSRLLQSTTWRWFDVLLGGGKTSGKIKKETSTCWKLRPGSSPGLRNCRCGPGAVVTVSPSHASELGWTSSSASFSPFSSKTFFLPPTDIRDSQGNRHLSCSLGIVPPYPGHGGRLLHSQLEDRKTQGGIPRSLPPATPNPLPFLLKSLNPRDTSASASSLFLSRFVCGTPTQPSWREWRKVHPLMSTLNIREEKKNKKEDEEMKASEANHGVEGNPDENKNKAADRTKRETEKEQKRSRGGGGGEEKEGSSASIGRSRIADIVAFLESANETSDDDDLTLDPRLYIALLLALIGGVCIVSPCIISLYNCYKHPRDCGRGVRSWCCYCCLDRHTAVHPHPISHDDTSTSDSGLFDVDEGQEEEEEAFYEQEKAHLSMGGGVHGHQIDPCFDRLSLKKQRSEATDHSKSTTTGSGTVAAAVMSTVVGAGTLSRGISGGTTSNADYEPFFAITGDDDVDEDEDHEGEGTEHINHHMFT